ncbi:MAG: hypothetical protein ABIS59_03360 [Candidatus Saccharibacteria bacterium]
MSVSASAAAGTKGPGSFSVTAVVSGPRPSTPATISSPTNGQTFQDNPITISGSCPSKTLVKIFTNGIFVGSAICDASGHFKLQSDLVIGKNELTALPFNANNQSGPESSAISVTLNFPNGGLGFSQQLLLQSSNFYRGALPGEEITWPLEIIGGVSPYAVNFNWGDSKDDLLTRPQAGPFELKHTYQKVGGYLGTYPLIVKVTDAAGNHAFLQLTSIVNSPKGAASNATALTITPNFKFIWPLWIVLLFMILSFWFGERREKTIMQRQMAALA